MELVLGREAEEDMMLATEEPEEIFQMATELEMGAVLLETLGDSQPHRLESEAQGEIQVLPTFLQLTVRKTQTSQRRQRMRAKLEKWETIVEEDDTTDVNSTTTRKNFKDATDINKTHYMQSGSKERRAPAPSVTSQYNILGDPSGCVL